MRRRIWPAVLTLLSLMVDTSVIPFLVSSPYIVSLTFITVLVMGVHLDRMHGMLYGLIAGLLQDKDDDSTLIPTVSVSDVPYLKKTGIISGGMIPKIDCCVEAVRRGVKKTSIIDGRVPHSILIELLTNEGVGTQFI